MPDYVLGQTTCALFLRWVFVLHKLCLCEQEKVVVTAHTLEHFCFTFFCYCNIMLLLKKKRFLCLYLLKKYAFFLCFISIVYFALL